MTIAYFMVNSGFKEERWGRMMFLSLCFHVVIFSMFLFFPQAKSRFPSMEEKVYHVELVAPPSGVEKGVKEKGAANIAKKEGNSHVIKTKTRRIAPKKKEAVAVLAKRVSSKPITKKREKDSSAAKLVDKAISQIEKRVNNKQSDSSNSIDKAIAQIEKEVEKGRVSQPGTSIGSSEGSTQTLGGKGGGVGMSSGIGKGLQVYLMKIEDAIKTNWTYPVAFNNTTNEKAPEATIILTVRSDGKILKAWFKKKSKSSLFDDSVLKAVERSDPLPKFPSGYLKTHEEVEINFSLKDLAQQ